MYRKAPAPAKFFISIAHKRYLGAAIHTLAPQMGLRPTTFLFPPIPKPPSTDVDSLNAEMSAPFWAFLRLLGLSIKTLE
jgi:hypothetical protein